MDMEQHIIAAGANVGPRITPADIEANIASEWYFTARDGHTGARFNSVPRLSMQVETAPPALGLLTFCVLVLRNGFTVTGESACASPENFKPDIGRRIAREHAVTKVGPLMGYELRTKLASTPADFRDRVRAEVAELDERIGRLSAFVVTELFDGLPEVERQSMTEQLLAMRSYSNRLHERISRF